jgi:hypothetical protein
MNGLRSDRFPTVRNFTFNAFLTAAPQVSTASAFGASGGGSRSGGAASGLSGLPAAISLLGPGQRDIGIVGCVITIKKETRRH